MNKKSFCRIYFVLFFSLTFTAALAQEKQNTNQFIDFLSNLTGVSRDSVAKEFSGLYSNILEDTEVINKVLDTYVVEKAGLSFLRDVNLRFKTFRTNGQEGSTALGFSYSYSKDIKKHLYRQTPSSSRD